MKVNLSKGISLRKHLDAGQLAATRVDYRKRLVDARKAG